MSESETPEPVSCASWLDNLGLSQYADIFQENNISLELVARLNDAELRELGVTSLGHRKILLHAISELRRTGRTAYIPPPDILASPVGFELRGDEDAVGSSNEGLPPPTAVLNPARKTAPLPAFAPVVAAAPVAPRPWWRPRLHGKFLYISIAVHVLFALGATYFIVQTVEAKRKLTFQAGPKTPNPSQRSIEHKVSMAKKQTTMSAPVQPKRITTTGAAKVALPDVPAMPTMEAFTPGKMAGMGGMGNAGFGGSGTMGGGVGGGSGMTMFGFREAKVGGLKGTLYDLKQTPDQKPIPKTDYFKVLEKFIQSKYDPSTLKDFYQAKNPLYATKIFIPSIPADSGPKAFGMEKEIKPSGWFIHYAGGISPAESGRFRFWGTADDVLVVAINGKTVMDGSMDYRPSKWVPKEPHLANSRNGGMAPGDWIELSNRETYRMDLLIGERPGGQFRAILLVEQEGKGYQADGEGVVYASVFSTLPLNLKDIPELEGARKVDPRPVIMTPKRPISISGVGSRVN